MSVTHLFTTAGSETCQGSMQASGPHRGRTTATSHNAVYSVVRHEDNRRGNGER
jgi:hypothetical protein